MSEQSKNSILSKIAAKHHIFKHNSVTCVQMTIYLLQLELVFSDILIEMGYCYDGLSLYFYITSNHMFRARNIFPQLTNLGKYQYLIFCNIFKILFHAPWSTFRCLDSYLWVPHVLFLWFLFYTPKQLKTINKTKYDEIYLNPAQLGPTFLFHVDRRGLKGLYLQWFQT